MSNWTEDEVLDLYSRGEIPADVANKAILKIRGDGKSPARRIAEAVPGIAAEATAAAGHGFLRGAAGLGDLLVSGINSASEFVSGEKAPKAPSAVEALRGIEDIYQPEKPWTKYVASAAEMAAPFVPTTKLQLAASIVSGLGAEAGENFLKDNIGAGPARAGGALLPVALSIPLGLKSPGRIRAAQGPLQELGPDGIREAWSTAQGAERTLGAPAGFWQGASNQPAISGLAESLMRANTGGPMRSMVEQQLPVGRAAAEEMVARVPGVAGTQEAANSILAGGKKVLQDAQAAVRGATKPIYQAAWADTVDPTGLSSAINKMMADNGIAGSSLGGKPVKRFEKMLTEYAGKQIPVLELRTHADAFRSAATKAYNAGDSHKGKAFELAGKTINDFILPQSENLKLATRAYKGLSESLVDPVENSIWSKVFPESMRKGGFGNMEHFVTAFKSADPAEIPALAGRLRMAAPGTFPSVVKETWQRELNKSVTTGGKGETPANMLEVFADGVAGGKGTTKRAAFQETMKALAREQGRNPDEVVAASDRVIDALYVYSRGREGLQRAVPQVGESGKNLWTSALESFGLFYPIRTTGRNISALVSKKVAANLTELFTDPSRVDELLEIAKFSPTSHRFKNALRGALGVGVAAETADNPAQNTQ